jgi:starch synthase
VGQVPQALASLGCKVTVAVPSYGFLHGRPGSRRVDTLAFRFHGYRHMADLYEVPPDAPVTGVRHMVVEHPLLGSRHPSTGEWSLYTHDTADRPFATDATRFAFFCAALAEAVCAGSLGGIDVIHLHDWHAAPLAFLRAYAPEFEALKAFHTVYTIHNLALQGVRPIDGDPSSLRSWFPDLSFDPGELTDPRWPDCVNFMRAGIRLSDAVHTVSPSYAREILSPGDPPARYGGEGLETDLVEAERSGHLFGILNGCPYPAGNERRALPFSELMALCRSRVARWSTRGEQVAPVHFLAHSRMVDLTLAAEPPEALLTCVGRVTEQKMLLMGEAGSDGQPGLESILALLGSRGLLVLLGTGEPRWERRLLDIAVAKDRFLFLNGYSDACAEALYTGGDLFLMPSSFEPCGISQMLSMRAGQPCVAHAVGGLKDTVKDGENGFSFNGTGVAEQVDGFVRATGEALSLRRNQPDRWRSIRLEAAAARFSWEDAARRYMDRLYGISR